MGIVQQIFVGHHPYSPHSCPIGSDDVPLGISDHDTKIRIQLKARNRLFEEQRQWFPTQALRILRVVTAKIHFRKPYPMAFQFIEQDLVHPAELFKGIAAFSNASLVADHDQQIALVSKFP